MFNFSRDCEIVFQTVCTILRSHQQCVKIIVSPYLCQNLVLSNFSHSRGCEECGFNLKFPDEE